MENARLTLSQLNKQIKESLLESFPVSVWVTAEILELNLNRSGHCYMELIEKSDSSDHITARIRGTIWAFQYRMLRPYFESVTGITLKPGLNILFKCTVEFHEQYGISLNITDIDPNFTMGDLARRKQEVIMRLRSDGVFEMNRETDLPQIPQRIAIISSPSAAGYGDFMNTLKKNSYGYVFYTRLFPAIMQGIAAEESVISALEQVYDMIDHFDCAVLIRGGGSQADLDCFNSYDIASHIAQFPIPVLTGIGHERDETVADMVAHTRLKTPTAVAEFLIDQLLEFDSYLNQLEDHFGILIRQLIQDRQVELRELSYTFTHLVKNLLQKEKSGLDHIDQLSRRAASALISQSEKSLNRYSDRLMLAARNSITVKKLDIERYRRILTVSVNHSLALAKQQLQALDRQAVLVSPENTLKRGFTITRAGGRIITNISALSKGDEITTLFRDGELTSRAEKIVKHKKKNG